MILIKDDIIQGGIIMWIADTITKDSIEPQFLNDPLGCTQSQKGIPTVASVIVNAVAIGHAGTKAE
jgi:hypothetical protein